MRESTQVVHLGNLDHSAFEKFYASVSPALFGIILRIIGDPVPAGEVLLEVFICLHKEGHFHIDSPSLATMLPIVFYCIEKASSGTLSEEEIHLRIDAEKERMFKAINSGRGTLSQASTKVGQ